jgi:hypothetical protein
MEGMAPRLGLKATSDVEAAVIGTGRSRLFTVDGLRTSALRFPIRVTVQFTKPPARSVSEGDLAETPARSSGLRFKRLRGSLVLDGPRSNQLEYEGLHDEPGWWEGLATSSRTAVCPARKVWRCVGCGKRRCRAPFAANVSNQDRFNVTNLAIPLCSEKGNSFHKGKKDFKTSRRVRKVNQNAVRLALNFLFG